MAESRTSKAPAKFIQLIKQAMSDHPDKPSLRQVAKRADLSVSYLSYLLNGDRGVPSNEGIAQLERVLRLPEGSLFEAAGKPSDQSLALFRKDETHSIIRALATVPSNRLGAVRKMIESFSRKKGGKTK